MKSRVQLLLCEALNVLKAQGVLDFESPPSFNVEVPRAAKPGDTPRGDWASNVALVVGRVAKGKKPPEVAQAIAKALGDVDRDGYVAKTEVVNAFLNFTLKDSAFGDVAKDVLSHGERFGRTPPKSTGKKVLVEFVSANPTGPVHIGHARGSFMGDGIARLMDAAGHDVTREFYINDSGKQVETLGRTIYKRYRELFGEAVTLAEGEYPAEYVIEIAKTWKAEVQDSFLSKPEAQWLPAAIAVGIRENMKAIRATLAKANISHDVFFSEQSLHDGGKVLGIAKEYVAAGVTYEAAEPRRKDDQDKVRDADSKAAKFADRQAGGTFLMTTKWKDDKSVKQSRYKDEEDRILLRADGTPVYLTADLAYHRAKFERGFDRMVDVFGADHSGHVPRIATGMKLLGLDADKLDFVLVQIVRITRGGEEVKVSKRKGTLFELADLIDEAGPDVCRFIFLMKTANAQFDFDLDDVAKQSKTNPVFYFQYGHARCASILKKALEKGQPFVGLAALTPAHLAALQLPEEKALLKKMSQLPEVVASAADRLEPHHVLYFCQELIGDFHAYYTQYKSDPVINVDPVKTQGRLAMVAALKQTLKNAFAILGISAPEHMDAPEAEDAA